MNDAQEQAFRELQRVVLKRDASAQLPRRGEKDGYFFTEVDGITILIGQMGGFSIPAVRSYPGNDQPGERSIDAASDPSFFFKKQAQDPSFRTGHFHPIINTNWRCGSDVCPCRNEEDESDRKYRSLGRHKLNA